MQKNTLFVRSVLAFLLGWAFHGLAEETDVYEMSLDQLLQVEVSVASTRAENPLHTPAVVSRLNVDELKAMGLHSLDQLLSMLPGVQVQDTAIGTKSIMVRGLFEGFNQKVLFLLDGVPYWQPAHGDVPVQGIALESIDRIEVIRGPGTVFHGSNASAGVINIVTRKDLANSVAIAASNNDSGSAEFYAGFELGEGQLQVSGHWRDGSGYDALYTGRPVPPFLPPATPSQGIVDKESEDRSFYLRYHLANFHFSYHQFRSANSGLASAASILNLAETQQEGRLLHLSQSWLTEQSEFQLYADYNNYFQELPTQLLFAGMDNGSQNFGDGNDNYRARVGGQYILQAQDDSEWVLGGEFERRETGDYLNTDASTGAVRAITMDASQTDEWSAYGQWLKQFGQNQFTLGFRYVNNEKSGSNFLPRASWIRSLSQHSSLKLIYSNGFNSPNFIQQGIEIPPNVITGNPALVAETVETIDLAYNYNKDNTLFVANLYWLQAEHFIQRDAQDFVVTYVNAKRFDRTGVELDYQFSQENLVWKSNLSYQHKGNEASSQDIGRQFVPGIQAILGVEWLARENHSLGLSYQYQSRRDVADASNYLNLQYNWKLPQVEVQFTLENLLGDDYLVQDLQDLSSGRLIQSADDSTSLRLGAIWQW